MPSERVQRQNNVAWNDARAVTQADFFTIGYSGRDISDFIAALLRARVATLVDVRFRAGSRYRPEFSKRNLQARLAEDGVAYLHRPSLGVPRDIRARASDDSRHAIWEWYDEYAVPSLTRENLHELFPGAEHPLVFMCTELDPPMSPTAGWRSRWISDGLRGYDL